MRSKTKLSQEQTDELLDILKIRFEKNKGRHTVTYLFTTMGQSPIALPVVFREY